MSVTRELLIARLEAIARSAAVRGALAVLGLGSCADLHRLDAHSDLDFFVIVPAGEAHGWRETLDWLSAAAPLASAHRNTHHGWKVLFADGVYSEFAVFETDELQAIPFTRGRVVWAREGFDHAGLEPAGAPGPIDRPWEAREAQTNLLVGLMRLHRGERLSAWRSICVSGVWHTARALAATAPDDPFDALRRLEQRDPATAAALSAALAMADGSTPAGLRACALRLADLLRASGLGDEALDHAVRKTALA
jgi:hypothetical protein